MQRDREPLEPFRRRDLGQGDALHLPEERSVFRKTDIDNVSPVLHTLLCERFRKQPEIVQFREPADHIVSDPKIVQGFVQFREPGVHPIKQRHN